MMGDMAASVKVQQFCAEIDGLVVLLIRLRVTRNCYSDLAYHVLQTAASMLLRLQAQRLSRTEACT